jgi:hypothetical protein
VASKNGANIQVVAAGSTPIIGFAGVDTIVNGRIATQGGGTLNLTEPVIIGQPTSNDAFSFTPTASSSNNVNIATTGIDTNISITMVPKGTGTVSVPTLTSTGLITASTLTASGAITASVGLVIPAASPVAITTGNSYTLVANQLNVFTAGGTIAAATFVFPSTPPAGTSIHFVCPQTITALTLSAAQGINGNISTLTGNAAAHYLYVGGSWYKQ